MKNTTVEEVAFTRALLFGVKQEEEVISLADNFGPFQNLLESEGETENVEAKHGTVDRLVGEIAADSEGGFGFRVGASPLDCTPPSMGGVFNSISLSGEKHEGKLASSDTVFGPFESDTLLERGGEVDDDSKHSSGHPVQDKLAPRTKDGKGVGGTNTRRRGRPLEPILLSGSEGEMDNEDQRRIGQWVQDELTPRTKDRKGVGVATERRCMGTVKSGKEVRIGNNHPTPKPKQERHSPYALAYRSNVTSSDYNMSYCELLRRRPDLYKSRYGRQTQHISGAFGGASSLSATPNTSSNFQGSNTPPARSQVFNPYDK